MQVVLTEAQYTYDASLKQIVLAAPYDSLDVGQIYSIVNITTNRVIYNSNEQRADIITIAGATITYTAGNGSDADTDKLQIIVDVSGSGLTGGSVPFDHEILTVADTAVGLTAATYLDATKAEIAVTKAEINMWVDGTDPTATVGEPVQIGDRIVLDSPAQIAGARFIRTGGTSAELPVHYFH